MDVNHVDKKQRKSKQLRPRPLQSRPVDSAFNLWLERGLHDLYDQVAFEPVPDDLLKLMQEG